MSDTSEFRAALGDGPAHLCLLLHCLTTPDSRPPLTHDELFVPQDDVADLLETLAANQFAFALPEKAATSGPRTCAVTFDDGYANNALFLPLAERYRVPFILFVSSLNIEEQLPFLWDIKSLDGATGWRFWADNYAEAYGRLGRDVITRLLNEDNHRPFTTEELQTFASGPWTHLGLHTHTHQPLTGHFLDGAAGEIERNRHFLSRFPRVRARDLALPCGLYTRRTLKRLGAHVDRIYTCDGGSAAGSASVWPRISLVNPRVGGSLISQVQRSLHWKARLRRKLVNIRYSSGLLNGI